MLVVLPIILVVFSVFILMLYVGKRRYSNLNSLPGPKPNLFFGNLIDFLGPTDRKYSSFFVIIIRFLTTLVFKLLKLNIK